MLATAAWSWGGAEGTVQYVHWGIWNSTKKSSAKKSDKDQSWNWQKLTLIWIHYGKIYKSRQRLKKDKFWRITQFQKTSKDLHSTQLREDDNTTISSQETLCKFTGIIAQGEWKINLC